MFEVLINNYGNKSVAFRGDKDTCMSIFKTLTLLHLSNGVIVGIKEVDKPRFNTLEEFLAIPEYRASFEELNK